MSSTSTYSSSTPSGVAPAIVKSARLGSCAITRPRLTNCGSVIPRSMNLRVCSLTPAIAMRPIFIGGSFLSENLTKKNEGHAGYDRGMTLIFLCQVFGKKGAPDEDRSHRYRRRQAADA